MPTPASPATSTTCGRPARPVPERVEPAQLHRPADERSTREPPCHARQYGRGQRGWKRAGSLRRPAPCWRCHLRPYRPQHQPPPAARGLLASAARRPSATHQPLMGSLLLTFGHARSASTPVSPACWLCILPSRPLSAFGLDDRAKVSATTSGADPRSPAPTTLSSPVAPARLYDATSSRTGTAAGDVSGPDPPGLPLARRLPGGSLVGAAGGDLPCQARSLRRAPLPPRARRAWSTFGPHAIGSRAVRNGL